MKKIYTLPEVEKYADLSGERRKSALLGSKKHKEQTQPSATMSTSGD